LKGCELILAAFFAFDIDVSILSPQGCFFSMKSKKALLFWPNNQLLNFFFIKIGYIIQWRLQQQ